MTGWAVTQRLIREVTLQFSGRKALLIAGTAIAALLTTGATLIIFEERFWEGAWAYFILIPILYLAFTFFRQRIGAPSPEMDYLGHIDSNLLAGFGFGQALLQAGAACAGGTGPAQAGLDARSGPC